MKLLKAVLLTGALLVALASPARAQGYPGEASLTCTPATAVVGEMITMVATGYAPGTEVSFTINSIAVGTSTADADGVATLVAAVPASTPPGATPCGSSGLDVDGNTLVLSSNITIVAAVIPAPPVVPVQPPPSAPLPVTGADTGTVVQMAVAIVALGGLLLLISRKKTAAAAKAETSV